MCAWVNIYSITVGVFFMQPTYRNVPIERIKTEYNRKRGTAPIPLSEVADLFGWDYYDFCLWLRDYWISHDFKLHVRTAREAKLQKLDNCLYLLDYYLVSGYSYGILAIIFNYEGEANVWRVIRRSKFYQERIKNKTPRKKTCRPKMIEVQVPVCLAVSKMIFNTHQMNRYVYRGVDLKIPVRRNWQMDVKDIATFYFFEPIYEIVTKHCQINDYDFNKFVNMALIQSLVPGAYDEWVARPSALVK